MPVPSFDGPKPPDTARDASEPLQDALVALASRN